jgi:hypothetical protein
MCLFNKFIVFITIVLLCLPYSILYVHADPIGQSRYPITNISNFNQYSIITVKSVSKSGYIEQSLEFRTATIGLPYLYISYPVLPTKETDKEIIQKASEYTDTFKSLMGEKEWSNGSFSKNTIPVSYSSVYLPDEKIFCSNNLIEKLDNGWVRFRNQDRYDRYLKPKIRNDNRLPPSYKKYLSANMRHNNFVVPESYTTCFEQVYLIKENIRDYDISPFFEQGKYNLIFVNEEEDFMFNHYKIIGCDINYKTSLSGRCEYNSQNPISKSIALDLIKNANFYNYYRQEEFNQPNEENKYQFNNDNTEENNNSNSNPTSSFGNGFKDFFFEYSKNHICTL